MTLSNLGDQAYSSDTDRARIQIVLLDDHVLFRESLARLLASEQDFQLVAECSKSLDALKILESGRVDVILVDLSMAKELIPAALHARYPGKFLVVARDVDAIGSAIVLKLGASGIFLESESSSRLIQAIRMVANGEAWVDQKVIKLLADRYSQFDGRLLGNLTDREQAVLNAVVDGLSTRRISDQIGASESSVKAVLQQLFSKAGVRSRSQLVRIAMESVRVPGSVGRVSGE